MKDTMRPLRIAIFSVLDGNISYDSQLFPIYDKKVFTGEFPQRYGYFGNQRESDITSTDCGFETKGTIDIVLVDRRGSEISQEALDNISDQIYELLLNSPGSDNLPAQPGFQIFSLKRESAVAGEVLITATQSVLQKVITLSANILQ